MIGVPPPSTPNLAAVNQGSRSTPAASSPNHPNFLQRNRYHFETRDFERPVNELCTSPQLPFVLDLWNDLNVPETFSHFGPSFFGINGVLDLFLTPRPQ